MPLQVFHFCPLSWLGSASQNRIHPVISLVDSGYATHRRRRRRSLTPLLPPAAVAAAAIGRHSCQLRPPLPPVTAAATVSCNRHQQLPPPSAAPAITAGRCLRQRWPRFLGAAIIVDPDHCLPSSAALAAAYVRAHQCCHHCRPLPSLSPATPAADAVHFRRPRPLSAVRGRTNHRCRRRPRLLRSLYAVANANAGRVSAVHQ